MHPTLDQLYQQSIALFRADPRIRGAWEFGSIGKGTSDAYSDVDPVFVVRDEDFVAVDAELPALFERLCKPIQAEIALWWPESFNSEQVKNYAVLLRLSPDTMFQYDVTLARASSLTQGFSRVLLSGCGPIQVLFDPDGLIQDSLQAAPPASYRADKLVWTIERYWLFVYIHVKYLKRQDEFRLRYAQQELFSTHMDVLHALYPDAYWGWWPWAVKHVLSPEQRNAMSQYFCDTSNQATIQALRNEMQTFAHHAQQACQQWSLPYPTGLEKTIRSYFDNQFPGK